MDNNGSCSGGNPLKGLSEHLDRNNALHQDRLRNGSAAGQAGVCSLTPSISLHHEAPFFS